MLDVKTAVKEALKHFADLFPNAQEVRLEEVDLGTWWEITISFTVPMEHPIDIFNRTREYKTVRLDSDTGEFKSVHIRKI